MDAFLDRIEAVASQRDAHTAVVDEERRLSYSQLRQEFTLRRQVLLDAGVSSGDRIAIVAENSAAYLTTVLAVWAADAVAVTIYPSTSAADLAAVLADADPVLVIFDARTGALVASAAGTVPVASMDGEFAVSGVAPGTVPSPAAVIDRLCLICYSSGTTARPKAIMLSAEAILNTVTTWGSVWRLSPSDATLVCLPMAWLFGLTTSSMSALYAGGKVVVRRRAKAESLLGAIEDEGVTFFPAVTTVLTKLAAHLQASGRDRRIRSLRLLISGGEPRNETAFGALERYTGIPVHDNYCASEMQPLVSYDPLADPVPRPGSAGKLLPGAQLRIVDADGVDVPVGEVGEGLSCGIGLMLGYWNDPAQTAQVLTADGWYRTKDLLRMDEEGYLFVVGRASDMIIRGGSNVSPGEIEACLREAPGVLDAAVVGLPDPIYGEEVVAAVRPQEFAALDSDLLREFASSQLAGFKVPTRFIEVEWLPLNETTGKVDRKAVKRLVEEKIGA